jgi:hypothetical protein
MEDIATIIIAGLLMSTTAAHSSMETVLVRHFVADFIAGRYNFKLPFQRKEQWKADAKSCWIVALLKRHLVDPLSISKPGTGPRRGINGGNRARATVDYISNRFPIVVRYGSRNHSIWFDAIPDMYHGNRFHHVLPAGYRERLLDTPINLNIRHGLTLNEEVEWYHNMNKNQVAHTPGHILNGIICKEVDDPFVVGMLRLFPSVKGKYSIAPDAADEFSLGSMLETISGVDIDVMDERDKRDDCIVSMATLTNLLACGNTYDKGGFNGRCDLDVLNRNAAQVAEIFDGYTPSGQMMQEFVSEVKNKPYQKRFWSATYLLGAIFYSIAKEKPDVVHTWKQFLASCVSGTIDEVYFIRMAEANIGGESNATRYANIWTLVSAYVSTMNTA